MDEIETTAYEIVLEKIRSQRADIQQIRNRASIAAAMTGLIATFFATLLGDQVQNILLGEGSVFGYPAVTALLLVIFAGSIGMSIAVLTHERDFHFSFKADQMISPEKRSLGNRFWIEYIEDGEFYFADNELQIQGAQMQLKFALILGWAQIVPWVIAVGSIPDGQ